MPNPPLLELIFQSAGRLWGPLDNESTYGITGYVLNGIVRSLAHSEGSAGGSSHPVCSVKYQLTTRGNKRISTLAKDPKFALKRGFLLVGRGHDLRTG